MFNKMPRCAALLLLAWLLPRGGVAEESWGVRSALDDAGQYVTAPLRWDREDWAYVGVTVAALATAHEFDGRVRALCAECSPSAGGNNSLRDAVPALAIIGATAAYAGLLDDQDGYQETGSLLEAGVFSTAAGEILKLAAGRERPDVTNSPNRWRSGGDSFPSVHASAAFAIGAVFAESGSDEYRWIRRVIGYGVAAGTAYVRVRENAHWLSDTVAGAAVGIATARFVLHRQSSAPGSILEFGATADGWRLSYVHGLK